MSENCLGANCTITGTVTFTITEVGDADRTDKRGNIRTDKDGLVRRSK